MHRRWSAIVMMGVIALAAAGCRMLSPRVVAVTAIARPLPGGPPPTPQLPTIQLEYNGNTIRGYQLGYQWVVPGLSMGGGAGSVPPFSTLPGILTVPAGQSINIILNHSLPPAYIVVELDARGVPLASDVLVPTTTPSAFQPTQTGQCILQVTAQWSREQLITYAFAIEIQ